MMKLSVDYMHDPSNLQTIYLAVTTSRAPAQDAWRPAYRDTVVVNGASKRVVWAYFEERGGIKVNLWVRDNAGDRLVGTVTL